MSVLACFSFEAWRRESHRGDWLLPFSLLVVSVLLVQTLPRLLPVRVVNGTVAILPLVVALRARSKPLKFALCLVGVLLGIAFRPATIYGKSLLRSRNFFGTVQVRRDDANRRVDFLSGTTLHGTQSLDPALRREPQSYYGRLGPAGDLFTVFGSLKGLPRRVGIVGLGAGTLAAYAQPNETWTFFELNPTVVAVAQNPRLFSYLSDAFPDGKRVRVVMGDARLTLASVTSDYGLLLLDAFSGDSIPVHLLTGEALDLYLSRLAPSGILAWHISNRYIKLSPQLEALAASRGLATMRRLDLPPPEELARAGSRKAAEYVVMSRDPATLTRLPKTWRPVVASPNVVPWSDDRSSAVSAIDFAAF